MSKNGAPNLTEQLLGSLRSVLVGIAEPDQVLGLILHEAVQQTGAERGVLAEIDDRGGVEYRVLHRVERADGAAREFSRNIFRDVLESGATLRLDNAVRSPSYKDAQSVRAMRLVSVLCVPIHVDDRIAALIHLEKSRVGHFDQHSEEMIASLVEVAQPILATLLAGRDVVQAEKRTRDELVEARELVKDAWSFGRFVGRTAAVRDLERIVKKAAPSEFPVLLTGESGTGKGVIARIIHNLSPRSASRLVTVFCPTVERGLVESELFGHRKGAFTGAESDRTGKVVHAGGGTLFLDEIGELPLEIQPKILRLLQEKTFERVGDDTERTADVRIVAATNRDLERDVENGRFRRDLFERLNYLPIGMPALRERTEDIPLLLRHMLDQVDGGRWIELDPAAEERLAELDHLWPGNVRQLEQLAARLSLEDHEGPLDWDTVRRSLGQVESKPVSSISQEPSRDLPGSIHDGLPSLIQQAEKAWLERALARYPSLTRSQLAERLKISAPSLYKKLKQYSLGGRE